MVGAGSTGYNYNADDSISQVTDARGAVTSYGYNSRGLVEGIHGERGQAFDITIR